MQTNRGRTIVTKPDQHSISALAQSIKGLIPASGETLPRSRFEFFITKARKTINPGVSQNITQAHHPMFDPCGNSHYQTGTLKFSDSSWQTQWMNLWTRPSLPCYLSCSRNLMKTFSIGNQSNQSSRNNYKRGILYV